MAHRLGPDITADAKVEHGAEAQVLVAEVIAPAGEEVGRHITHHHVTLGTDRTGTIDDDGTHLVAGSLAIGHILLGHPVEAGTPDITPGAAHGGEGAITPGPTHLVLLETLVQFHDLAPVAGEIHRGGPVETVRVAEDIRGKLDFNTLVVDPACVHEHGAETDDVGSGDGEDLVLGLLLVVSDIQVEAVVKHADFGTDLPGSHLLRLEVQVRIGVALVHLGDAVEGAGGIIVVGIPVGAGRGTDLGDATAEFPEGKDVIGLESREGLGDNPAQGHGRIEEGLADGGAPVIAGGGVQVEHVLESDGDVAVHGVGPDMAVVHAGHGVTHLVADGIDTGNHQRIGPDLLIEILGVAIVGAEDGGDVEIADGLVRRGEEVGIQLGVGDVRGIEGSLRVIEFEVGLLEHAGVVVVETETAFDLEPVERVEI